MRAEDLARGFWHGPDVELANVGAISAEDYYARASSRLGIDADLVRAMVRELFVGEVNREFAAFVRTLRVSGVPVSALTNSWSSQSEIMARPEFHEVFDQVISSADVGMAKPDEGIYHVTMERLSLGCSDLVFVDDSAANVATARELGWKAIHFVSTAQALAEIGAAFEAHLR